MGNKVSENTIEFEAGDYDLNIDEELDSKGVHIDYITAQKLIAIIFNRDLLALNGSTKKIHFKSFINTLKHINDIEKRNLECKYGLQISSLINENKVIKQILDCQYEKQITILKNENIVLKQKLEKLQDEISPSFQCMICYEEYKPSKIKVLNCHPTHTLCLQCFDELKKSQNKKCPFCRIEII